MLGGRAVSEPRCGSHGEGVGLGRIRKTLIWVLVAFAVYAVFRSPDQAAGVVRDAVGGLGAGLRAVGDFFDALLSRGE